MCESGVGPGAETVCRMVVKLDLSIEIVFVVVILILVLVLI